MNVDRVCESSSHILKQFKVEGLYIVCSIDIVKNTQVLRVWDILPLEGVLKLAKRLDNIFQRYTDDFNNCCNEKCLDGYALFSVYFNLSKKALNILIAPLECK